MPAGESQTTSSPLGRFGTGMAHRGKRRPYCSVNLWAIVVTVLPMVICRDRISMVSASPLRRPPLYGAARRLRGGALNDGGDGTREGENTRSHQRETLYEAYNMLHKLAQDFHKPFDSPAVLVVGHQTSGKSALIEALMGFQFNQVGGGTKTRRPIALRMQYNPDCDQPRCSISLENGKEEPRSLQEIQAYIESENRRLERDPVRSFDSREINIRMEYRFCPNMILIDTPGLIHAPSGKRLNAEQRSLTAAAREAENLVLQKMMCQDYVILCVEDTTDWKHATTRNVVTQVDPDMSRTVLVTTKLDTKLPQFGASEDLEDFLIAPLVPRMYRCMLGGPFFTTVPSGRVGRTRDAAFFSNEAFVQAVRRSERDDQMFVAAKLGAQAASSCLPRVGVSRLRRFLERRVEECYRKNVARIVPQLQHEMARAEGRLVATEQEIEALSLESLKAAAEEYREHFSRALGRAIQGTIKAPPEKFGETLEAEQLRAGTFVEEADVDPEQWDRVMEIEVGNGDNKLFGGAQYHRVLREFNFAIRHMNAPEVTEDEIANAAGVSDMHDGVNFMRAACVIAVEKARSSFEPVLDSLRVRTVHVMKRLFEVVEHMVKEDGMHMSEAHQKPFSLIMKRVYDKFVEKSVEGCLSRCRDDLTALTRFVTWDLHERSAGALRRSLPDSSMVQIYSLAVDNSNRRARRTGGHVRPGDGADVSPLADDGVVLDQWQHANSGGLGGAGSMTRQKDYFNLRQLMEEASSSRDAARTSAVVSALVRHIMVGWREHFARTIAMKFNCFFLMPFVDDFPFYLRQELEKVYAGDEGDMFDIAEAREALFRRKEALLAECKACHEIQEKFDSINTQLNSAKEIYSEAAEQDIQAVVSEAEAEALAALEEGGDTEFDYSIEGSERRGELDTASSMELPSGVSSVVARRFGPGSRRSYPREGSASLGLGYVLEDSEEDSEDEEDFFFNPLSRVDPGAIGDKPPPTDSFDRRRWAAQRRAQREAAEAEASSVGQKSLDEEQGDDSASVIGTGGLERSLEVGRDGSRVVGKESRRPEVGDSVGEKGGASLEAIRATSPVVLEEALRRRRRNASLGEAGTGA